MIELLNELDDSFQTKICSSPNDVNGILGMGGASHCTVLHMNIRSLRKHFEELEVFLAEFVEGPDVIILSETFEINNINLYVINGYEVEYNGGKINRNDGVVAYVRSDIRYNSETYIHNGLNILRIELLNSDGSVVGVNALYRPFDCETGDFNLALTSYLGGNICKCDSEIIIGDMNINIMQNPPTPNYVDEYLSIMAVNGFVSLVNTYTRVEGDSKSCLDHIFFKTKIQTNTYESLVITNKITDHYPTLLRISCPNIKQNCPRTNKKHIDLNILASIVSDVDWEGIIDFSDVETSTQIFVDTLVNCINRASLGAQYSSRTRRRKPWMTAGLLHSINNKNTLYSRLLKSPQDVQLREYYRQYRNRLNHLVKMCKQKFYSNKIKSDLNNSAKIWKTINQLTGRETSKTKITKIKHENELITAPHVICDTINRYFVDTGNRLGETLEVNNYKPETLGDVPHSFFLTPVTQSEVIGVIRTLKNHKSPGGDGITAEILKHIQMAIVSPLARLINLSFVSGRFPDVLKKATVILIYKGGEKDNMGNYRPISLISVVAKVFEKLLFNRVVQYIEGHDLLSDMQFGFRSGKSSQDALAHMVTQAYRSLDLSKPALSVFLDLRKAFDSINHALLLDKLERYGFRGTSQSLFKSYLMNRVQTVKIQDCESNPLVVNCGVPQGTILGPFLFVLYLNDMFLQLRGVDVDVVAYADDIALFVRGEDWNEVRGKAEICLRILNAWFSQNRLFVNTEKSKFLCFTSYTRNLPTWLTLKIHEFDCNMKTACSCMGFIDRVEFIRYLGVVIDACLNWGHHIDSLSRSIRRTFYIFRTLRNILPLNLLKNTYYALVQSLLSYGILTWGATYSTILEKVNVIQRTVLKVMYARPPLFPTEELFKLSRVFKIRELFVLECLKYYIKNRNSVTYVSHPYLTRTLNSQNCEIIRARKTVLQKSYIYYLPKIVNLCPDNLRNSAGSFHAFVRGVKRWIAASGPEINSLFLS